MKDEKESTNEQSPTQVDDITGVKQYIFKPISTREYFKLLAYFTLGLVVFGVVLVVLLNYFG